MDQKKMKYVRINETGEVVEILPCDPFKWRKEAGEEFLSYCRKVQGDLEIAHGWIEQPDGTFLPPIRATESVELQTTTLDAAGIAAIKPFADETDYVYDMISGIPTIKILGRTITMPSGKHIVVARDNVSQLLTFEIERYFNAIDFSDKVCVISYTNANKESGKSVAVNMNVGEDKLTFGWLLSDHAAAAPGTVKFSIGFVGYNEHDQLYIWQTALAELKVEEGVWTDDSAIVESCPTIIEDMLIQIGTLQRLVLGETTEGYPSVIDDMLAQIKTLESISENVTKTVEKGQPNFSEAVVTSAAWSGNLATTAVLGAGWSGEFPTYTHEAGNTENLSIPLTLTKGEFYEIVYTQTGTSSANKFNMVLATTAVGTSGQTVKTEIYYDTTFVVEANNNYSYVNIVPTSGWSGTFTLTSVKKAVTLNSASMSVKGFTHIVNGTNNIEGGGGRVTTGKSNTATGYYALRNNTIGNYNTANGYSALYGNTTGGSNTATGYGALYGNTTGSGNTSTGINSLVGNTTGRGNTANGYQAMYTNITGDSNTATGYYALRNNTIGNYNTANGYSALYGNTTGGSNTATGYQAGRYLSNGTTEQKIINNSVFIGTDSKGAASDNQMNQIVIGYNATGNGSNTITLGDNQITSLHCQVTAITALSDIRTKDDVEAANLDMCYEDVKRLPIHRYKYKDFTGVHLDTHVTGFLADDVEQVFPKSVQKSDQYFPVLDENGEQVYEEIEETDEDGDVAVRRVEKMFLLEDVKSITMTEAIPTLWGAMQKLMEKIEQMENKIS